MRKNLTTSQVDRQNILNNEIALEEFYNSFRVPGIMFEGQYRYTKEMVADFFEVDIRTIERYINNNTDEFKNNGYEIIKGAKLRKFRQAVTSQHVPDINVGNISSKYTKRQFVTVAVALMRI